MKLQITEFGQLAMRKNKLRKLFIVAFSFVLLACADHAPAPVVDLSVASNQSRALRDANSTHLRQKHGNLSRNHKYDHGKQSTAVPQTHKVIPGETLYSIAWRYSLDYQALAKLNHIHKSQIFPGQILQLNQQSEQVFSSHSLIAAINSQILNKSTPSNAGLSQSKSVNKNRRLSKPHQSKSYNRSSERLKPVQNLAMSSSKDRVKRWIWPVNGKVISHFSKLSNQNKGLDIAGIQGSAVRATAKGKVVYSGSGLRGYGRLVIIKHNDSYLSAYAHNEKLLVSQDEFVKAGQRIADLGNSGADRTKLHFEIRYKGKPVDPLNYLPKKGRM